jgi:hypothetical protein
MELNKLKGMSDISEEVLIEKGITSISVIQEKGFGPRMLIRYENEDIETIDGITEMEKFIQNLQKTF